MTTNIAPRPEIGQTLQVTRQAIQALDILQYSQEELAAFVAKEAERNPLIALSSIERGAHDALSAFHGRGMAEDRYRYSGSAVATDADLRGIEDTHASRPSLSDHLCEQLSLTRLEEHTRSLAVHIIGSLDGDGYFRRDLNEMAELMGTPKADLAAALKIVQGLEPAGVAATSLGECLRLQLEDIGTLNAQMRALLENLDMLANGDLKKLARLCGVDVEELGSMARQLRRLTPSPGTSFDWSPLELALPDIIVTREEGGKIKVELNTGILPKVLVDRTYWTQLTVGGLDGEGKRYLSDCLQNATSLVRSLDQRATTMMKIAAAIVEHQRDYLVHGVSHLRPLSQKAVAKTVGVHESTVCRAIANKHMLHDHRLVPMKFFFPEGVAAEEGRAALANETVRSRIHILVKGEKAHDVRSDDAIVAQLNREGIEIARRTVAKYRTQLNIPPSAQRRRLLLIQ